MILDNYIFHFLILGLIWIIVFPIIILIVVFRMGKKIKELELKLQLMAIQLKTSELQKKGKAPEITPNLSKDTSLQGVDEMDNIPLNESTEIQALDCGLETSTEETPPPLSPIVDKHDEVKQTTVATDVQRNRENFINEVHNQSESKESLKSNDSGRIEKLFGGNFFAKIGILTLVLGVSFFVKYSFDQNWIGTIGRVSLGFLFGGLLIILAHRLANTYKIFSSILIGGGIAIFYVTIGLGYYDYAIFTSLVSFMLSIGVTIFAVVLSYLYGRQELGVYAVVGGFIVPLLASIGENNIPMLYGYIFILNCGILAMSLNKNWKVVGTLSYILTLLFFLPWLCFTSSKNHTMGLLFASLFYIQFYTLALILYYRSNRVLKFGVVSLLISNNLAMLCSALITVPYHYRGLAILILAIINAIVLIVVFRQMDKNRNLIYLMIGVVISLISIAIPVQLEGYVITIFWSVEAVLLLWLWHKSKIKVIYLGYVVVGIVSLISIVLDYIVRYPMLEYGIYTEIFNKLFLTGLVFIVAQWVAFLILKKYGSKDEWSLNTRLIRLSYSSISQVQQLLALGSLFFVVGMEIDYLLSAYEYAKGIVAPNFRLLIWAVYLVIFTGLGSLFVKRKKNLKVFIFLIIALLFYAIYGLSQLSMSSYMVCNTLHIFYTVKEVAMHFWAIAGIICIYATLIRLFSSNVRPSFRFFVMITLVIIAVKILTSEFDAFILLSFSTPDNYYSLMSEVELLAHPILWGLLALLLMLIGLKRNDLTMRQISILFFGFIIVKFYLIDVWGMTQAGRIASFIVLGLILLIVSFMQQKIKNLVSKKAESEEVNVMNREE